jgi:hypothetical protein
MGTGATLWPMGKPSTALEPASLKPRSVHRFSTSDAAREAEWADAETRAFMERPRHLAPLAKVLRVILITGMVVAVVKIAWILAVHA